MIDWSDADRAAMRAEAEAHMMDVCYVWTATETRDKVAGTSLSYVKVDTPVACTFEMHEGREARGQTMTVIEYEATLRVPVGTTIHLKDRIEITEYQGETASWMFEVVTTVQVGISAYQIGLNRVEI